MNITKLKVRLYPDPCLTKKSVAVKHVGPAERMLIKAMLTTMYEHKGVGLAAPQVGINEQIFVADAGEGPLIFVNPKLIKQSGAVVMEEGCLSIPELQVKIKRPKKIEVEYWDEQNNRVVAELSDLLARIFMHESDHLQGRLILDYLSRKERIEAEQKLQEIMMRKK